MKKLFIILVMICLSLPAFARNGNPNAPSFNYDNPEQRAYHKKLKQAFYKKYPDRQIAPNGWETTAPEGAYYKEVVEPYYEYLKTHPCKMEPLNKY